MTTQEDVQSWLGDVELTDEQLARFIRVWDDADERYPDADDQELRDAALSAAVQYMLGELTPEDAGAQRRATKHAAELALVAARQVAVLAVGDGAAEATTARLVGVDRMALLKWLGKR